VSLDVDVATENVRVPVGRDAVKRVADGVLRAERVRHALVSITFVDKRSIARLNKSHLGHAGPTDVISFGFTRATRSDPVVGDIYICADVAREHATDRGVKIREELTRLVVHGVLHILGYEHPEDGGRENSKMWKRQERLLARISHPQLR
jgi:probable rRNA maturation factor